MVRSDQIVDPRMRGLRKALRKAENFMRTSNASARAVGRWNKIMNKVQRITNA